MSGKRPASRAKAPKKPAVKEASAVDEGSEPEQDHHEKGDSEMISVSRKPEQTITEESDVDIENDPPVTDPKVSEEPKKVARRGKQGKQKEILESQASQPATEENGSDSEKPQRKRAKGNKNKKLEDVVEHSEEKSETAENSEPALANEEPPKTGTAPKKVVKSDADSVAPKEEEPTTDNSEKPKKAKSGKRAEKSKPTDGEDVSSNEGGPNSDVDSEAVVAKKPKRGKPKQKAEVAQSSKNATPDDDFEAENPKTRKTGKSKPTDAQDGSSNEEAPNGDVDSETVVAKKKPKRGKPKQKAEMLQSATAQNAAPDDDFEVEKPKAKKTAKPKKDAKSEASSKKEENAPKALNRSILQLKIQLRHISPPIWRRIQVLNNDTFKNLNDYIQEAMGWFGSHTHQFIAKHPKKKDSNVMIVDGSFEDLLADPEFDSLKEQSTKLSKFLNAKDDCVMFEYDMGDSWMHDVVVEKVLPPPPPKADYPKCTGGKRACPPEDCGGVDGYNHLVEVYKDPEHAEYEELIAGWLKEMSPGWEPEKFQKGKVYKKVRTWVFVGP